MERSPSIIQGIEDLIEGQAREAHQNRSFCSLRKNVNSQKRCITWSITQGKTNLQKSLSKVQENSRGETKDRIARGPALTRRLNFHKTLSLSPSTMMLGRIILTVATQSILKHRLTITYMTIVHHSCWVSMLLHLARGQKSKKNNYKEITKGNTLQTHNQEMALEHNLVHQPIRHLSTFNQVFLVNTNITSKK